MAKQNTTPKQSSGGGYPVENEAVALVLAHLLARSSPFHPPGGIVERVDTQRPATEWHLDDLLVTARVLRRQHRLAFSIKSNRQITREGFPSDFIRDAWEQLLHDSSDVFVEDRDYLGLLTAPLDVDLRTAVYELLRLARDQEPDDLAMQIGLPNRTNAVVRKLHRSAQCPDDLAAKHAVDVEKSGGRLLRRVLWSPLDFEDDGSVQRAQAITLCRGLLRSGSEQLALALWERLQKIADRLRRSAGGIDLPRLIDELRVEFELRDFPDYEADWERIGEDTQSALSRVRTTIGGRVSLPRTEDHDAVTARLADQRTAVLLGASGTGKSAVAKSQAQSFMERGKVLWLNAERLGARTLAEWRTHLGLNHPLGDVVRTVPASEGLLVFDGLDRLYGEAGFAAAAEFVAAARIGDTASAWRLLITCTPEEWGRVRDRLASRSVALPDAPISLGLPGPGDLQSVWDAFPQLTALHSRHHLAPVLFRPKVLDLLATHCTVEDDLTVMGESDLARLFWDREVALGPHGLARAEAAIHLAQSFADRLLSDVSESALTTEVGKIGLAAVGELVQDRVLVRNDGRLAFEHDLYGDWVRVRQLRDASERGELAGFLASRLDSPVWHRALRLYAVDLLEQADSLAPWTRAFESVATMEESPRALAQDILLEATAFASGRGVGLFHADLWNLLAEDDGKLLARLLKRLFHTTTFANTAIVEAIARKAPDLAIHIAAGSRVPYFPYWYGILTFLYIRREEVPVSAYGLAARAADLWLRSTLPGWPLRKEATSIAVALGDALLKLKQEKDWLYHTGEPDQHVYRAVLAAGHEEPERVTQLVLEAAGRRSKRFAPPPPPAKPAAGRAKSRAFLLIPSMGDYGPLPEPWPHGPAFRVDGALQEAVLESDALQPLTTTLPDVARELLLALLISEPTRRTTYRSSVDDPYALEWRRWHPEFYTRGPFRAFLATAEGAAVTAILQLIEHATDRWVEGGKLYVAGERGCSPDEMSVPEFEVEVAGEMRAFTGGPRVFGWSLRSPDRGDVIGSALVALEKHLYDRADAGDDLSPLIHRLLTESRSLAIIGVLATFARRHPHYLRGPLKGLLGSPDMLSWTSRGSVNPGWPFAGSLLPEPLREAYREWHEMPHRRTSLRDWMVRLFISDLELRPFFASLRNRLSASLQPGGEFEGWDLVEGLVTQLSLDNYTQVRGDDGNIYVQYAPPEELRSKYAQDAEQGSLHLLLMTLPMQLRQMLEQGVLLDSDALDQLWSQVEKVAVLGPDKGNELAAPANVLAGAAAVITLLGGEWRVAYPDRARWARTVILQAISESAAGAADGSVMKWDRYAFAVDAVHVIWSESPDDPEVWRAVARLALHGPPEHVGTLAGGVAQLRGQWPEDHKRLLRAILLRAGLDARLHEAEHRVKWVREEGKDRTQWENEITTLREKLASVERDLVERTLDASVPGLEEIAPLRPLPEHKPHRPDGRVIADRKVNDTLLIAAFRGIPNPEGDEQSAWLDVWETVICDALSPLRQQDDERCEEPDRHPDSWDYYLMERAAAVVATLADVDSGRRLWHPIIELGASAESWVSWFAREWTRYALHPTAADHVLDTWTAMIDEALISPRWAAGGGITYLAHETGELWRALWGFTHTSDDVWSEDLRPRVRGLESRLAAWAKDHLFNIDNVRVFAHILAQPAAADIVLPGLGWLHDSAKTAGDRFWGRAGRKGEADDMVLSLLIHVWEHAREPLRQDAAAFGAFRGLLERLVSRQYPPAFELADRVGT